ncbi:RnfABCDGE type electron transport complex subunit B [Andreprevotia chitinilytica]|uniref:RnfABCDGE type electron transport complex subunit B n=1 Tax=Andreprevotia chitinilytica TaxID=396808 RepID=UPI00068D2B9D|nr:RnfABCDGE type electron transport complex subunit B [Andreprevotia chitinilytica]
MNATATVASGASDLVDQIDAILPQTQCRQCGFDGCRPYAEALAAGTVPLNQCPPGGAAGIVELAALLKLPILPLSAEHGIEQPRELAVIDEECCIGCTLCIQACPVDAIFGAAKQMHTVINAECTGCALCVAPCPVDCIDMVVLQPVALSRLVEPERSHARGRYQFHQFRLDREQRERHERLAQKAVTKLAAAQQAPGSDEALRAEKIRAAMARASAKRGEVSPADEPAPDQPAADPIQDDAEVLKQARIAAAIARATALRKR